MIVIITARKYGFNRPLSSLSTSSLPSILLPSSLSFCPTHQKNLHDFPFFPSFILITLVSLILVYSNFLPVFSLQKVLVYHCHAILFFLHCCLHFIQSHMTTSPFSSRKPSHNSCSIRLVDLDVMSHNHADLAMKPTLKRSLFPLLWCDLETVRKLGFVFKLTGKA
ncbi:uncharacterized protein [Cicer arietinum]|uniref:uncharacterized protein n=1 Tax=Cicer arietinum TaxID=3827 RepID=UPI003CC61191